MPARNSIYHKLILYVFLLGVFVIVSVSLYSFVTARNAILDRTYEQLTSLRVAKKEQVEQFFSDRQKEILLFTAFSAESRILNFDFGAVKGRILAGGSVPEPDSRFLEFFRTGNYFSSVYLDDGKHIRSYRLDSSGASAGSTETGMPDALRPLVLRARTENRMLVSDFLMVPSDSLPCIYIAAPLAGSGPEQPGIAVFGIRAAAISSIMNNKEVVNGMGKSGEVYLVGPDSLMRSESRFIPNAILHTPVRTESVREAFASGEGTRLMTDYRGIPTLSSYSRLNLPGLDWVILAEIDRKEAMRPVNRLANEIVFLSIFITLILFVAAYIISRTITLPVIRLKDATIRVRHGDFEPVKTGRADDEIGELTDNFNRMILQLNEQQKELKSRETRIISSFIDGQEDERQRLSRELHDGLGQMIVATKLRAESLMESFPEMNAGSRSDLRVMFDNLVSEVRGISNDLMPAALKEFGLETALRQICRDMSLNSGVAVVFDSSLTGNDPGKRIMTYVFRIAQEAISNAVRHSGGTEVVVSLIGNERMISLTVQDNGFGMGSGESSGRSGRGLNSIYERVRLLNGIVSVSGGGEGGTIVAVKIPFETPGS
jgi:signal transduction histidine kinase